jgi:hypothetical protein
MSHLSVPILDIARRAWPRWFDKVADRLPGVRTVAMFGKRAVSPERKYGETWKDTFERECITEAPADWIRERSIRVRDHFLRSHASHARTPFPDVKPCLPCSQSNGSWKKLAFAMYNGNPFSLKMDTNLIPYMEPEHFRAGAGTWGGKPSW